MQTRAWLDGGGQTRTRKKASNSGTYPGAYDWSYVNTFGASPSASGLAMLISPRAELADTTLQKGIKRACVMTMEAQWMPATLPRTWVRAFCEGSAVRTAHGHLPFPWNSGAECVRQRVHILCKCRGVEM